MLTALTQPKVGAAAPYVCRAHNNQTVFSEKNQQLWSVSLLFFFSNKLKANAAEKSVTWEIISPDKDESDYTSSKLMIS